MSRYPVFIVGSPRSGTSLLVDALLSAGYHGFREGNFLPLITALQAAIDQHFSAFAAGGQKTLIGNIDKAVLSTELLRIIKAAVDPHTLQAPWFDKSGNPAMIMAIGAIRSLWPESVFIFAKRRGIENLVSRIKKFPNHNFEYHCKDWSNTMLEWRNVRDGLPPGVGIEVDQQDYIRDPSRVAANLVKFLQLPADRTERMLETFQRNRPQETESGSAARVYSFDRLNWPEPQKAAFLTNCLTEMQAYGYTFDESYDKVSQPGPSSASTVFRTSPGEFNPTRAPAGTTS